MDFMHDGMRIDVIRSRYGYEAGSRIALVLMQAREPYANLTVNIPEEELADGEFFVKTWSENEPVAASALKSGLFVDTGRRVKTGYTEVQVWRFA